MSVLTLPLSQSLPKELFAVILYAVCLTPLSQLHVMVGFLKSTPIGLVKKSVFMFVGFILPPRLLSFGSFINEGFYLFDKILSHILLRLNQGSA